MSGKARDRRGAKRPVLGDIVEIPVSAGFAYAQFVLNHTNPPRYGPVLRVFPEFYQTPLGTFEDILLDTERYLVFYPIGSGVKDGIATIVGSAPIPARLHNWPLFKRAVGRDQKTGEVRSWATWKGKHDVKYFHVLPLEYFDLSIHSLQSHATFLKQIESGWHPRDEVFRGRPDLKQVYEKWKRELKRKGLTPEQAYELRKDELEQEGKTLTQIVAEGKAKTK